MAVEQPEGVGGVEDRELAPVAGLMAALPNVRASRAERFARAVRMLVERRAQDGWPGEGTADAAVFVLVDYPRKIGQAYDGTAFADPMAQGTPLLGRLFFASADASHGQYILAPTAAGGILEWLEDQGLAECPLVTVYRGKGEMFTRRLGIEDSARSDRIRDREPAATVEELIEALTHYHRSRVVTPSGCPAGVWQANGGGQYIPGPRPERSIQTDLQVALNFWFRGVVWAGGEDSTNIGRIDVRLLKKGAADEGLTYWAILELKVVKSYSSTGTEVDVSANVDAIVEGVRQAGAYGANRRVEEAMLEIYDLRRDKADLVGREEVADVLGMYSPPPRVHVWRLYGSASDARKAREVGF